MFARACTRASRTSSLRPALRERPKCPSAFHSISPLPIRRPLPKKITRSPWSPVRRNASTRDAAIKLFKENPFSMAVFCVLFAFCISMLFYVNWMYQTYIIGEFKAYPEPVAAKLRRALYYTDVSVQPQNALKYFRQALEVADEMGLDPFSDEMLGVKFQVARLFEKVHQYQQAINVLVIVRGDCLKWIEKLGGKAGNEGKRTRVLSRTIGISRKLGELYANEYVLENESAEEMLVWAVTTLLKELKTREDEGVKEGEGPWMSNEEIGGSLEALGHLYESRNQHFLAAPLFLQALGLCPASSCHSVVLMNNLAVSLALQNPPPSLSPNQPPVSPASYLSDGRQWAQRSLTLAASIKPPERTEECDEGCAVATINLGEFAMMEGNLAEAQTRYQEGKALSKGIGFQDGVVKADEFLKKLHKKR